MARINPGVLLVVIILLLLLYTPSSAPSSKASRVHHISSVVAANRQKLQFLESSDSADFNPAGGRWLNLTGWRQTDGYKWDLLDRVRDIAKDQAEYAAGLDWLNVHDGISNATLPFYHNLTGVVKGEWVRSDVTEAQDPSKLNLTALAPGIHYPTLQWTRNITGKQGKLTLHVNDRSILEESILEGNERHHGMRDVSGRITIQDETSFADGWGAVVYGVHHIDSGSVLLATTSEKFDGIFGLPHLSLTSHAFNESKACLNRSLNETIERQNAKFEDVDNPWTSTVINEEEGPVAPTCELVVYAQQHLFPNSYFSTEYGSDKTLESVLELLEKELRFPEGRKLPRPPSLAMSLTVFSPDCGFVLESKGPPKYAPQYGNHLQGFKVEVRVTSARHMLIFLALVLLSQLMLLVREMKLASTPARRSRISFYTVSMLSLGSGVTAFSFLFLSGIVISIFILSLTVAFLGFMDGLFFAMKFLMEIWTAQEPERLEQERRRQRERAVADLASTDNTPRHASITNADGASLPLPATAPRPIDTGAAPIIIPPDQDAPVAETPPAATAPRSSTFGAIYTRYCLTLLSIVFFSIWAASSAPLTFRTIYANTLCFVYLSFWIPQIYRNIIRNGRKALSTRFVVGQSILRLLPIAYFWAVDDNVLFVETDMRVLLAYITWLWIQIALLTGQEIVGPRFFVNEKWAWVPVAWDYHPVLREDEEGATMPIGFGPMSPTADDESGPSTLGSGAAKESRKGKKVFDCAICMQTIDVPVVPADGSSSRTGDAGAVSGVLGNGPGFLVRRTYMVTPCRHIFHTECLEGWIGYRLQCPICRETLPPL